MTFNVLPHFVKDISQYQLNSLGNGLINDTYLVRSHDDIFVLQRINTVVFNNPQAVVDNSLVIAEHLNASLSNYSLAILMPRPSLSGQFVVIVDGCYWRATEYIDNAHSVESIVEPKQARAAAYTFARFSMALSDVDVTRINPIIDNFHDLNYRLIQLEQAILNASEERLSEAQSLIKCIQSHTRFIDEVTETIAQLPLRITHNDTKINNLLLDNETLLPKAVIDLDTCMPGYLLHDFGDMVRTCCNSLAEDATNIEAMTFKSDIFDELLGGYQAGLGDSVTAQERSSLLIGVKLMPFMLGVRFLTDYLNDDVYFLTRYCAHNLDRAANQLAFYQVVTKYLSV